MSDPTPVPPPQLKIADVNMARLFEPTREYGCAQCGFRLKGLPDEGACPECGQRYTRETAVRLFQPPRISDVLAYLAVPLALPCSLFVLGAVPLLTADDILGACLCLLGLVTLAPCTIWLGRRFASLQRGLRACLPPQHDPSRDWRTTASTLGLVGQILIGGGWIFVVLTVLVGGACLALVMVKLGR